MELAETVAEDATPPSWPTPQPLDLAERLALPVRLAGSHAHSGAAAEAPGPDAGKVDATRLGPLPGGPWPATPPKLPI